MADDDNIQKENTMKSGFTDEELSSFLREIKEYIQTESFSEMIKEVIEAVSYPNFEPLKMRELLGNQLSGADIIFLCNIGVRFGNNTRRITSSMRCQASRSRLVRLINKLRIKDRALNDHKAVTLSRVMASFPEVTLRIVHEHNPHMLIPHDELKAIHAEFPAAARTAVAASVLPHSLTKAEVMQAFALITVPALKTSEILSARDNKWVAKSRWERAKVTLDHVTRCFSAKVISNEVRIRDAVRCGMVEQSDVLSLTAAWQAAGAAAMDWLKSEYNFDLIQEFNGFQFELLMAKVRQ